MNLYDIQVSEVASMDIVSTSFKAGERYYFKSRNDLTKKKIVGIVAPSFVKVNLNSYPTAISIRKVPEYTEKQYDSNTGLVCDVRNGINAISSPSICTLHDVSVYVTIVDINGNEFTYQMPYHAFFEANNMVYSYVPGTNPSLTNERAPGTGLGYGYWKDLYIKSWNWERVDFQKSYIEFADDSFINAPQYGGVSGAWVVPFNVFVK